MNHVMTILELIHAKLVMTNSNPGINEPSHDIKNPDRESTERYD